MQDDLLVNTRQLINEVLPNRKFTFSSYNLLAIASMLSSTDLIGFMPYKIFEMFSGPFQLKTVGGEKFSAVTLATTMHFNKLSSRDPILQEVINAIIREFEEE